MKISILGLGWFGEPLAEALMIQGHELSGTTRSEEKQDELIKKKINAELLNYPENPSKSLLSADLIILNIPPFPEELEWFKKWPWQKDSTLIFISSTSKSATLLEQEEWVKSNFLNSNILRFAGLYGNSRHPGKHLSGKKNLKGRLWPVKLLSLSEALNFTMELIGKKRKERIVEVISLTHPSREEFYTNYCKEQGLPLPEFDQSDVSTVRNS